MLLNMSKIEKSFEKSDELFVKNALLDSSRKDLIIDLSKRRQKLWYLSLSFLVLSFISLMLEMFSNSSSRYIPYSTLIAGFFGFTIGLILDSKIKVMKAIDKLIDMKKI